MKATLHIAVWSLALMGSANAAVLNYSWSSFPSTTIPDTGRVGWSDTRTVPTIVGSLGEGVQIADINVTLQIKNGRNGDYKAILSHGSDYVVLLNRAGRSASAPSGGFERGFGPTSGGAVFLLDDQATYDVHLYTTMDHVLNSQGQLTGTWQPDGRDFAAADTLDTTPRTTFLSLFNGKDSAGAWTLTIYDTAAGPTSPGPGIVVDWGMDITIVPEPVNVALGAFAGIFGLAGIYRKVRQNRLTSAKD